MRVAFKAWFEFWIERNFFKIIELNVLILAQLNAHFWWTTPTLVPDLLGIRISCGEIGHTRILRFSIILEDFANIFLLQVLLNTLIYFNVKYFMLKTTEEHKKLSFTHIMKHFKKGGTAIPCSRNTSPGEKQTLLLRYYPPADRKLRHFSVKIASLITVTFQADDIINKNANVTSSMKFLIQQGVQSNSMSFISLNGKIWQLKTRKGM